MKQPQQKSSLYHPKRLSIEISQILEKTLIESKAIDRNSLSILVGKYVWEVEVEISLVNNAGNLIDACYMTTLMALMSFRLPLVKVGEGEKIIICNKGQRQVWKPLSIHHVPVMITIVFMNETNNYVIDPLVRYTLKKIFSVHFVLGGLLLFCGSSPTVKNALNRNGI